MKVIKRDGREVLFNKQKIINAILGAFNDCDFTDNKDDILKTANDIANFVENKSEKSKVSLSVEEIQDIVEQKLMATKYKDVAKKYILFRAKRTEIRNKNSKINKSIEKKLKAINVENQNANIDEKSFGGKVGTVSDLVLKEFALNNCMSKKSKENHLNNEIYIHDLNSYAVGMHNCLSVPIDKLLKNGFNTRQTDVRPAKSINTALQLVAVLFQIQSLQEFGGVSATHLDWSMEPYIRLSFMKHYNTICDFLHLKKIKLTDDEIRKTSINDKIYFKGLYPLRKLVHDFAKKLTIKETYQSVEGLYHNLNTLQSRSGNQLPFSSINYGTCTSEEGRIVIKALLDTSIKGIGKLHRTSVFPCGIFQLGKGINEREGDPNYDMFQLALKSTSQRLYPNYANIDWSGNAGYDKNDPKTYFSTMGKV